MKLMNEAPLYVLPTLALILGVDKAILLQKLHECLHLHGTEHGGERWYCQPIYHWHKKLPFFSEPKIKRLLIELEREGYISSTTKFNLKQSDRTKWYRINYKKVEHLKQITNVHSHTQKEQNLNDPEFKDKLSHNNEMDENALPTPTTMNKIEPNEMNHEQNKNVPGSSSTFEHSSYSAAQARVKPIPTSDFAPYIINNIKNKKEKKKINKKEKKKPLAQEVIAYLNEKAFKRFNKNLNANLDVIIARLEDGYTVEDCKAIIDEQTKRWLHDDHMSTFLRPQTLFRASNIDTYLSNAYGLLRKPETDPNMYEVVLDFEEDF